MSRLLSWKKLRKSIASAAVAGLTVVAGQFAGATDCEWCVSEIYFNPPGTNDASNGHEYIELFGPASTSWSGKYLLQIENESGAGGIDAIWNLTGVTNGSNGYTLGLMKGEGFPAAAAGTTVLTNSSSNSGFGRATGAGNIGFSDDGDDGDIENSGGTFMLINVDSTVMGYVTPSLSQDLDTGGYGLDTLPTGWSILDSIGVHGEEDDPATGSLYADINFGPGASGGNHTGYYGNTEATVQAHYAHTDGDLVLELEWVGRQGIEESDVNELGKSNTDAGDWIVANLTDNAASGFNSLIDNYGVSGEHDGTPAWYEAFEGNFGGNPVLHWSYGFDVTDTFGAGNHTPEPTSIVMLGIGAMGLLLQGRHGRS
jgi:hypothetical protein